jgi:hypothetical protein
VLIAAIITADVLNLMLLSVPMVVFFREYLPATVGA